MTQLASFEAWLEDRIAKIKSDPLSQYESEPIIVAIDQRDKQTTYHIAGEPKIV